jgi:hypothetical protein|tara:strand:+ start:327 stop:575 length:249 start_codon:yes stop_codon:yes gene_type:complete
MLCVEYNGQTFTQAPLDAEGNCNKLVILNSEEYNEFMLVSDIFAMPEQEELIAVFELIFNSVMILFCLSYFISRIVSLVRKI